MLKVRTNSDVTFSSLLLNGDSFIFETVNNYGLSRRVKLCHWRNLLPFRVENTVEYGLHPTNTYLPAKPICLYVRNCLRITLNVFSLTPNTLILSSILRI